MRRPTSVSPEPNTILAQRWWSVNINWMDRVLQAKVLVECSRPEHWEKPSELLATLLSTVQTTRGHHAPCGRQSPRSPGNRTHLSQLSLDRTGHLAGTPVHRAASSATVKKPWMSSLVPPGHHVLEPRVPGFSEKLAASQTWAVFPTHEPHLLFPGRKSTTPHRTTAHLRLHLSLGWLAKSSLSLILHDVMGHATSLG